jgi:hypothetical protein
MNVTTPLGVLTFRTYWQPLDSFWMLDISDSNGNPILTGMPLLAGCQNLIAGIGQSILDGYSLAVFVTGSGGERTPTCWGTTAALIMAPAIEGNWITLPDPMVEAATW